MPKLCPSRRAPATEGGAAPRWRRPVHPGLGVSRNIPRRNTQRHKLYRDKLLVRGAVRPTWVLHDTDIRPTRATLHAVHKHINHSCVYFLAILSTGCRRSFNRTSTPTGNASSVHSTLSFTSSPLISTSNDAGTPSASAVSTRHGTVLRIQLTRPPARIPGHVSRPNVFSGTSTRTFLSGQSSINVTFSGSALDAVMCICRPSTRYVADTSLSGPAPGSSSPSPTT
mmetsp:Transcript_3178/g.9416  ORF Transcript_3178/g.9416 Transcript_3178/m.9416 type:complete len:226 (-) Transcript_3178:428-1105(-)